MPRGDARASGYLPVSMPFAPDVAEARRFFLGGKPTAQFVAGHGHLFFPVNQNQVEVYRESDGMLQAVVDHQGSAIGALAVTDEYLLIAGNGGLEAVSLLPLLTRGQVQSRLLVSSPIAAGYGPTLVALETPAMAFVATQTDVCGISLTDLHPVWTQPRQGRGQTMLVHAGKGLVVVEETGHLWNADLATGEVKWRQKLPDPVDARAGATAWENRLYLLTRGGALYMIFADHNRVMPTPFHFDEVKGMACTGTHIYLAGGSGVQRCGMMDTTPTTMSQQVTYAAPLIVGGTIFVGTGSGTLAYMDAMAQFERDAIRRGVADMILVSPVLVGNRLYIASDQGEVVIYSVKAGGAGA